MENAKDTPTERTHATVSGCKRVCDECVVPAPVRKVCDQLEGLFAELMTLGESDPVEAGNGLAALALVTMTFGAALNLPAQGVAATIAKFVAILAHVEVHHNPTATERAVSSVAPAAFAPVPPNKVN